MAYNTSQNTFIPWGGTSDKNYVKTKNESIIDFQLKLADLDVNKDNIDEKSEEILQNVIAQLYNLVKNVSFNHKELKEIAATVEMVNKAKMKIKTKEKDSTIDEDDDDEKNQEDNFSMQKLA